MYPKLSRYNVSSALAIRNRVEPEPPEQDIVIEIDEEEKQPESSSWAQGGRKRKNLIEIPNKAREKALQILPIGSKYFDYIRHNFLIKQATKNERIPDKLLEVEARMIDERIIQAQEFMKYDDFTRGFK